jgi:hypothetical protein
LATVDDRDRENQPFFSSLLTTKPSTHRDFFL